jgi:branched-chain amino acid transport system ATP-binding protein
MIDGAAPSASEALLDVRGVSVNFGGVLALNDVTFAVRAGEFLGLIGPNGAGKTTILNIVSRIYPASAGAIRFADADILACEAHEIAAHGISRTFQNLALCGEMTVRRNVMLGGFAQHCRSLLSEWLQLPSARAAERTLARQADEAMALVGIAPLADAEAGSLSHGSKRKVELARALCGRPKLLMLDEPASGLTDDEIEDLVALLKRLRHSLDLTIIVIEHHLDVVLALSDRLVVLDMGRVIAEGAPEAVTRDPAVLEAYIGTA